MDTIWPTIIKIYERKCTLFKYEYSWSVAYRLDWLIIACFTFTGKYFMQIKNKLTINIREVSARYGTAELSAGNLEWNKKMRVRWLGTNMEPWPLTFTRPFEIHQDCFKCSLSYIEMTILLYPSQLGFICFAINPITIDKCLTLDMYV